MAKIAIELDKDIAYRLVYMLGKWDRYCSERVNISDSACFEVYEKVRDAVEKEI